MKYLLFIALCLCQRVAFCQTNTNANVGVSLPSIALLDIENSGGINLNFTAPNEAGGSLGNNSSNNSAWINFTSSLGIGGSRSVTAYISSGISPSGYAIVLETATYSGAGGGQLGYRLPFVSLSNMSQKVIDNIGGAFTGNGMGNGYNLRYSLAITNYGALRKENTTFTITYTLTDN